MRKRDLGKSLECLLRKPNSPANPAGRLQCAQTWHALSHTKERQLGTVLPGGQASERPGDLKQKAHEVGCDMVLPRSAFSQNLPQLLRRHGAPEGEEDQAVQ